MQVATGEQQASLDYKAGCGHLRQTGWYLKKKKVILNSFPLYKVHILKERWLRLKQRKVERICHS